MKFRKVSMAIMVGAQQEQPDYVAPHCKDTLGVAFLGSCYGEIDLQKFYQFCASSSDESIAAFITRGLMHKFPRLAQRVSAFDPPYRRGLVDILHRQCPELVRIGRGGQRLDPTLFKLIAQLEEKMGWSKQEIAGFLAGHGL